MHGWKFIIIERVTLYVGSFVCMVLGFRVWSHGRMLALTKLFHLVSRNSGDSPLAVWLSVLVSINKRNFRNGIYNLSTVSGGKNRACALTFLACMPEIGGRRFAMKNNLRLRRSDATQNAVQRKRIGFALRNGFYVIGFWLDQVGVLNACCCSGFYGLSSLS